MRGANAAVVGVLGAALYDPVFTAAIGDLGDLALALACLILLLICTHSTLPRALCPMTWF